ncbi:MAG TPA: tryptophan synthase subunit alpha [Bacteroidia bacterium]|jgi:tryptophan synthase alpha chain|nr:tryptophan synthase subunit alpha [Bacteroidia bacterium]
MNRIQELFKRKKNVLSVYFTAGFPALNDTRETLSSLALAGVDMIEIGIPFSDPLADGPVIQQSSEQALRNGMTLKLLFSQLKDIRKTLPGHDLPLLLMGYLNPVMQFGLEAFCREAREAGIDGVIIPDLPLQEYLNEYKSVFESHGISNVFLITPQTSEERIRLIDSHTSSFIYMVSSASTTGAKSSIDDSQIRYFERVRAMKLKNPVLIGFGISDRPTFERACEYADGAIIGSAFIRALGENKNLKSAVPAFIRSIQSSHSEKTSAS